MAAEPPKVRKLLLACIATDALVSVVGISEDVQTPSSSIADLSGGIRNAPTPTWNQELRLSGGLADFANDAIVSASDLSSVRPLVDPATVSEDETGFAAAALEAAFDALSGGLEPATVTDALSRAPATGDVGGISALSRLQDDPSGAAVAIREALEASGYNATTVASLASQVQGLVSQGVPPGILMRLVKQGLRAGRSSSDLTASLAKVGSLITSDSTPPGQAANHVQRQGNYERTHQTRDQHEALGDESRGSNGPPRPGEDTPPRGATATRNENRYRYQNEARKGHRNASDKK